LKDNVEYDEDELKYDFTDIENFEIDGSKDPTITKMRTAFSADEELRSTTGFTKARKQIIFFFNERVIKVSFDDDQNLDFQKSLINWKEIVTYW
jgi:hypothetical protein